MEGFEGQDDDFNSPYAYPDSSYQQQQSGAYDDAEAVSNSGSGTNELSNEEEQSEQQSNGGEVTGDGCMLTVFLLYNLLKQLLSFYLSLVFLHVFSSTFIFLHVFQGRRI